MHQAVQHAAFPVETPYDEVEVSCVAMFVAPPHSPSEQVRDLNQTGRCRIREQWHFRHIAKAAPPRASFPKLLGETLQCLLVPRGRP